MNKSFGSDNHSGVHPKILQSFENVNIGHSPSYGTDDCSASARMLFKEQFGPNCEPFFVFNGTAANVLSIKAFLKTYESVICHQDSHLNIDECGAPEMIAGVKLIPLQSSDGKLTPQLCEKALIRRGDQHYSQVKMISITQPTELGTMYSYTEMQAIAKFCKANDLYFHIDGARFIHAPTQLQKTFKELTSDLGVDVVSFGGTKNGLLFGEAVLLFSKDSTTQFKYIRKQAMQLPSKMRFLASQFVSLFENELWKEISIHECEMAQYLKKSLEGIDAIKIVQKVSANSVFVKIPQNLVKPLRTHSFFYIWDEAEWIARWMMSFDTTKEDIDGFVAKIKELL